MSHVLGFSNREGVGSAGIELRYDSYLKGKEGHRSSKKDGRGREVYSARELDIPPENGATWSYSCHWINRFSMLRKKRLRRFALIIMQKGVGDCTGCSIG